MKMLKLMCGVIKMDKVRNKIIGGTTKIVAMLKKMQEKRLK